MLPLARIRAPREGWLVVEGRRGHYKYCDEIRAYQLSSGAAYIAQRCGALLEDEPESLQLQAGHLPVELLQETTWALLQARWVRRGQPEATYPKLPEAIPLSWPSAQGKTRSSEDLSVAHSSQTQLHWRWIHTVKEQPGTLTWPDSSDAGPRYAAWMLATLETALEPGCPDTPLPTFQWMVPEPGVHSSDASPADLAATHAELVHQIQDLSARCAQGARRSTK